MAFSVGHLTIIYLTNTLCVHLSCFQLAAIINSAVVNCLTYVYIRKKKFQEMELLEQKFMHF